MGYSAGVTGEQYARNFLRDRDLLECQQAREITAVMSPLDPMLHVDKEVTAQGARRREVQQEGWRRRKARQEVGPLARQVGQLSTPTPPATPVA